MTKITNKTKKVFLILLFACTGLLIALTYLNDSYLFLLIIPPMTVMYEGLVNDYTKQRVKKKLNWSLIYADSEEFDKLTNSFKVKNSKYFYITIPHKYMDILEGNCESLNEFLNYLDKNRIKEIIISHDKIDYNTFFNLLEELRKRKIKVKVSSASFNVLNKTVGKPFSAGKKIVSLDNNYNVMSHITKRVVDFILACIGVIILSPLFLVVGIIIKATSSGPIIFKQTRIGKNGKPFSFYKFRSMYKLEGEDSERKEMMIKFIKESKNQSADTKVINLARVTWIGKILRRTSLDELPQLFNVIKGDMSLVGPRPCIPYEFENYEIWHKRRTDVLPGCTGLWQVSGRSLVSFDESILLDLCYVYTMNLFMDIRIILKTLPVMFFSKGGK
ncbi:MAG: sugar transferase [Bacteroidota bacterium]|nr:sugar transferase [Bacteroidota bacterium]